MGWRVGPRRGAAAVAGLALVGALGLGACASGPAPLSDPREILDRVAVNLEAARSVHVEISVDGNLAIGSILPLPGSSSGGGTGGSVGLAGTHATADLDRAANRAAVRFEVPALLGLTGEARQIGPDLFLTSSLTSRGWHHLASGGVSPEAIRPAAWFDTLHAWLDRPATLPARLDDASCRAGDCYVIRIDLAGTDLDALASALPSLGLAVGDARVTMELRVERTSLQLSEASLAVDLAAAGSLDVALTFSAWDQPVSVAAPPSSEIVEGPLLP
jgi:hypothetical protein